MCIEFLKESEKRSDWATKGIGLGNKRGRTGQRKGRVAADKCISFSGKQWAPHLRNRQPRWATHLRRKLAPKSQLFVFGESVGRSRSNRVEDDDPTTTANLVRECSDYYEILGVERGAQCAEIRRSYLARVRVLHPDKGGDEYVAAKLNEAYHVLMDKESRAAYEIGKYAWKPVLYAKHIASSVSSSIEAIFSSQAVDWEELLEGDHIYFIMTGWRKLGFSHHGIVIRAGADRGDVRIVDFGAGWNCSKGVVQEKALDEFLPPDVKLYRAEYNRPGHRLRDLTFRNVAYSDKADSVAVVVGRARRLLMLEEMEYDLLCQSCETVAFWCKTGKRFSGQAAKFDAMVRVEVAVAALIFVPSLAVAIAEASVVGEAAAVAGAAVAATTATVGLSATGVGAIVLASIAGTALLIAGAYATWVWYQREKLKAHQPLEMIELLAKLQWRDRSAISQLARPEFDGGPAEFLARTLDSLVGQDSNVSKSDIPNHVSERFQECCDQSPHCTAEDHVEMGVQVLSRCVVFNAILDLPEPRDQSDALAILKQAEIEALQKRHVLIEVFSVSKERQALFLVEGTVRLQPFKIGKTRRDFQHLHKILVEIHPSAKRFSSLMNEWRHQDYVEKMIEHSKLPSGVQALSHAAYLKWIQAVEVREQIAAFLCCTRENQLAEQYGAGSLDRVA